MTRASNHSDFAAKVNCLNMTDCRTEILDQKKQFNELCRIHILYTICKNKKLEGVKTCGIVKFSEFFAKNPETNSEQNFLKLVSYLKQMSSDRPLLNSINNDTFGELLTSFLEFSSNKMTGGDTNSNSPVEDHSDKSPEVPSSSLHAQPSPALSWPDDLSNLDSLFSGWHDVNRSSSGSSSVSGAPPGSILSLLMLVF